MKRKRKKPILKGSILVLIIVLFCVIAKVYISNRVVSVYKYKYWIVNFKGNFTMDDFNKYDIKVLDSEGKEADISLNWGDNEHSIVIIPPKDGYEVGERYSIKLKSNIPYTIGTINSNKKTQRFKIKELSDKQSVITFKDKNLEQAVRKEINKLEGDILTSDVEKITSLMATSANISNLDGIEKLVNLRLLALDVNEISDLKPLKDLDSLELLGLSHNEIRDVSSLEKLINLRKLSLYDNPLNNYKPLKDIKKKLEWKDFE
jgi:internalin A